MTALLLGAWLGLHAASAVAAEPPPVPLCMADFPPFNSPELPRKGPLVEIATEAFRRSGREVEILFMPWARLVKEAEASRCVILGLWRNPARDLLYDYSQPIYQMELGFFGRRDAMPKVADPKGLLGLKICTQRGAYLPALLEGRDLLVEPVLDVPSCLRMLDRSRVDLAFGNRATGQYFLNNTPDVGDEVEWKAPSIETKEHYLAIAKITPQREAVLRAFDQGLSSMKADGSYRKILKSAGLDLIP